MASSSTSCHPPATRVKGGSRIFSLGLHAGHSLLWRSNPTSTPILAHPLLIAHRNSRRHRPQRCCRHRKLREPLWVERVSTVPGESRCPCLEWPQLAWKQQESRSPAIRADTAKIMSEARRRSGTRFAWRSNAASCWFAREESGSPGESHPQAPSEPYVHVSAHTAPLDRSIRASPKRIARCTTDQGPPDYGCPGLLCRSRWPLRSSPVTGPSPLLQATPPLCAASVLSRSRFCRLRVSLSIGTTGSHVPRKSPDRVPAAFMPDADRAVNRCPPALSRSNDFPPVSTPSICFRHLISGSLAFGSTIHT